MDVKNIKDKLKCFSELILALIDHGEVTKAVEVVENFYATVISTYHKEEEEMLESIKPKKTEPYKIPNEPVSFPEAIETISGIDGGTNEKTLAASPKLIGNNVVEDNEFLYLLPKHRGEPAFVGTRIDKKHEDWENLLVALKQFYWFDFNMHMTLSAWKQKQIQLIG